MKTRCEMIPEPWHSDDECGAHGVATTEDGVRVCVEHARSMEAEGFLVTPIVVPLEKLWSPYP